MKKVAFLISCMMMLFSLIGCTKTVEQQIAEQLELGQKYLAEANYEEAVIAFNKVIELDPKNVDAYVYLAESYDQKGSKKEAIEALEAGYLVSSEAKVEEPLVDLYTQIVSDQEQSVDERIEGYLRLMELRPENSAYYIPLSKLYMECGDEEKAIDLLETATEKTDDADVELELENIKNPVPEGASDRMRVRGRIIWNLDKYQEEWAQFSQNYQYTGIDSFGVEFSNPIHVYLENENIEISEAKLFSKPGILSALHDEETDQIDPVVGKEIELMGYFMVDKNYQEITGPEVDERGNSCWHFHPNGPYQFTMDKYYE